jgi:crotonobetainyl-CoA:carnitine CoA-transferase CaiB-like acyl-CoA transferase
MSLQGHVVAPSLRRVQRPTTSVLTESIRHDCDRPFTNGHHVDVLAPYRVLDLTDARGELATFVLAGLGAEVIKVEPAGGSPSRHHPPCVEGMSGDLSSLHFHAFNRGKRSVVIDLTAAAGRAQLLELVGTADFVFENAGPGVMDAQGIGYAAMREVRPDLVYVAISPYGQNGPYAHHLATDLTLAAMGGAMALNGDADRRPVRITVPQTWHHASVESAVGAMVAHHRRLQTGIAQFVDTSVQTAVFWTGLQAMIAHAIQGRNIERDGTMLQLSTMQSPLVYPCADGEVVLIATTATVMAILPWMIERGAVTREWADAEDWPSYEARMLTGGALVHDPADVRAAVTGFTRTLTKQELFDGGIARGATLAPVNTAFDVLAFEQLRSRDYWDKFALPTGQQLRTTGSFVKAERTPVAWSSPAPSLGADTTDVLATIRVRDRAPGPVIADLRANDSLPFDGVKFADFSWIGVGPITAKAFADHGATVVHVETDKPADRLRLVGPFKDNIPGVNRCQFFGSFNTSKLSLQLDLKHPEGKRIARRLLEWADIALDSFTAGTMNDIGLGYDVARELNPGIIMATTCLMGQTGPAAQLAGYGYHAAAVSGFFEITGWNDRPPGGPFNAYTDTVAPRFLATTLMAALDHGRRTGEGQFIDQAQMESALHFLAPELLEAQLSGRSPRRAGNDSPDASPHDAYACAGHDQWIAIAVETDEHWHSLRRVLGQPAWMNDPSLATVAGRRQRSDDIDRAITAFTTARDPRPLMEELQAAGVPAGMVQRSSDHLEDPQLRHRRFFRPLEHPEMGEVPYEGHQYAIEGYDHGPIRPAPCLGEHTYEVLSDVLGFTDDQVAELLASGACG